MREINFPYPMAQDCPVRLNAAYLCRDAVTDVSLTHQSTVFKNNMQAIFHSAAMPL